MPDDDGQKLTSEDSAQEFGELRELGLSPGTHGSTQEETVAALIKAIQANDLDEVRKLVDAGVDVNARYCSHGIWCSGHEFVTPLMAAASTKGSIEIATFLLKHGADPSIARELREEIGHDDFKWQGLGRYETALDLARYNPEVHAILKRLAREGA